MYRCLDSAHEKGAGSDPLEQKKIELKNGKTLLGADLNLSEADRSQIASRLMRSIGLGSAIPIAETPNENSVFDTEIQAEKRLTLSARLRVSEESDDDDDIIDTPNALQ